MYDLGLLTSTKVSFERVQTCTIHTSFSIFNCGWCCNGHKWWALHDQRHLKCVGTRPEGPCPLHNFVPTIDHIHVEICTKKLFQAAMIFFLPAAGLELFIWGVEWCKLPQTPRENPYCFSLRSIEGLDGAHFFIIGSVYLIKTAFLTFLNSVPPW